MNNPHIGSSFDDFLREDGSLETTTAVATNRVGDLQGSVTMSPNTPMCSKSITDISESHLSNALSTILTKEK